MVSKPAAAPLAPARPAEPPRTPDSDSASRVQPSPTLAELASQMDAFVRSKGWHDGSSARPQTERNLAISLTLEAAELLECFQWHDTAAKERVADELADIVLYALQLATVSGVDLQSATVAKLARNMNRTWPDSRETRDTK